MIHAWKADLLYSMAFFLEITGQTRALGGFPGSIKTFNNDESASRALINHTWPI